jgi:hypothetical protein
MRPFCEQSDACETLLEAVGVNLANCHDVASERDAIRLIEAGFGVGIFPASVRIGKGLKKIKLADPFERTVRIYTVAGRQRSQVLTGLTNLLRSADWTRYETQSKAN